MNITVSTTYYVVWQIKTAPQYKFTKDGICINSLRCKIVRRVKKGGSIGYNISGKFIKLSDLRILLEKISINDCPF